MPIPSLSRIPDFFIVGAAKAGTTSLFHYLAQHPDVFLCQKEKEPGYYCDLWGMSDLNKYSELFSPARPAQLVGDASTPYLSCPASPKLIGCANPNAKIIILLRNPADRAFSLYKQMAKSGHEHITPFSRALDSEEKRAALSLEDQKRVIGYHYNYLYVRSGFYPEQLERYLSVFPREQIRIILFDDLIGETKNQVRSTAEFLGISPDFSFKQEVFNPSRYPLSIRLQHFLKRKIEDPARIAGNRRKMAFAQFLKRANFRFGRNPKISDKIYNELVDQFADSVKKTAGIIGRNLDRWLEKRGVSR